MAAAAFALYAAWFMVAFGLRTLIHRRRTGDSGFRGLRGRAGSVEWFAGILFGLALIVGVAAPATALLGLDPVSMFDRSWLNWIGLAVGSAGVVATLEAQLSMGASWRIGVDPSERTDLVTGGAFALVRNPIFSAMLITAIGLTLMVPNPVALVGLAVLVAALELQVRCVEEPHLVATHGDAYYAYAERVGRFVPGVGVRASTGGPQAPAPARKGSDRATAT
jgi:protein-S-isoprenylcysteine O-methyltransferase Ste14